MECLLKTQLLRIESMTNTGLKSPVKKWTDENLIDPKFKFGFKTPMEMVCPKAEVINPEAEKTANGTNIPSKRWSTEYWLRELIEEWDFRFEDFISISFHNPNQDVIDQYLDNKHIRNVILDFFYKSNRPKNKIRLWFFVERESMFFRQGKNQNLEVIKTGDLHIHILMERIDLDWWLNTKNRKITLKKRNLSDFYRGNFPSKKELMRETLINHLQQNIWRCPKSDQGVDIRDFGEIKKRVHYVNKSLSSVEFDKWEHIDFSNSDLPCCPVKRPLNHIHSK